MHEAGGGRLGLRVVGGTEDKESVSDYTETLKYLGPLMSQASVAACCDFDERVWDLYRQIATQHGPIRHGSREYLVVRMMHIAESTSNGIRMTATWALTPPAMSLLRADGQHAGCVSAVCCHGRRADAGGTSERQSPISTCRRHPWSERGNRRRASQRS